MTKKLNHADTMVGNSKGSNLMFFRNQGELFHLLPKGAIIKLFHLLPKGTVIKLKAFSFASKRVNYIALRAFLLHAKTKKKFV